MRRRPVRVDGNAIVLVLAAVCAIWCAVLASGCGSVTTAADVDAGATVEGGGDDVGRDAVEDTSKGGAGGSGAAAGAAGSAAMGGGAGGASGTGGAGGSGGSGPTCSWDCRSFCDCGPLPCCRSTSSADCCTR